MKTALLAVSYGTAVPQAREGILRVEQALADQYPAGDFFRAFTSPAVRVRCADQGEVIRSLPEALAHLEALEYERVLLQPTHLIYSEDYDRVREDAAPFQSRFRSLAVGRPLIADTGDLLALARETALLSDREEALVLLGHGTAHYGSMAYPALQAALRLTGSSALVGTLQGWPGFPEVLAQLKADGREQVLLAPLMLTAGRHALRDMSGSWKERLETEGFSVRCRMEGLGRLPGVCRLYQNHLKALEESSRL